MRIDWRASAVAAGVAFLLSFLTGIIGGVSFGALLVRAILGAIVFGAGAAGVSYLIDRFLPDLKESLASGGSGQARPSGGRVNIVVDDESDGGPFESNDFDLEEADEPDSDESYGSESDAGVADANDIDDDAETGELEEAEPMDAELLEPEEDDRAFRPGIAARRVETGGPDEEVEDLEEAVPEETAPEAASSDSLPDIEGFSGSFADAPPEELREDSNASGEDPGIMARAIRTVLKREE